MEERTDDKKPKARGRTITDKQARNLLEDASNYFSESLGNRNYIGDRHTTEILADSMARNGHMDLAGATIAVHERVKQFHNGDHRKAIDALWHNDSLSSLQRHAGNTSYAAAVAELGQRLSAFRDLSERGNISWEASETNIRDAKRRHFPHNLSMIERLNIHQRTRAKHTR